jgi:hypothetical protein
LLRRLFRVAQLAVLAISLASVWSVLSQPSAIAPATPSEVGNSTSRPGVLREPEPPPTAHEREVQRDLEAQLRGEARKDRIETVQGRIVQGRILDESANGVRILRSFGDSGEMEMTLARAEIRTIEHGHTTTPPAIRIRDVRFKLEFPSFNLYRRPPFTIVTDQSFFEVEDATRTLDELHGDFGRAFDPLFQTRARSDGIQLLFFSDEQQFAAYRDAYAPALGYASGFYSPLKDRLVIFDQANSKWVDQVTQRIDSEREKYRSMAERNGAGVALHEWHQNAKRSLGSAAERANRVILRHEGAHQLFNTYGVHSMRGAEHLWLIEGLAAYCEERDDGATRVRIEELRAAGDASKLSFRKLVDFAAREGIGELGDAADIELFYPKAWLIVEHLMRNRRDAFFAYIRFVRDPENEAAVARGSDFDRLSRFLGQPPAQLERELDRALGDVL